MLLAKTVLLLLLPAGSATGSVRAEGTREPIPAATVQAVDARRTVRADERGFFVLAGLPEGRVRLRASAPGFAAAEREVSVPRGGSVRVDFELAPRAVALEGLEARGVPQGRGASSAGPGAIRIEAREITTTPALAEADVLRTVQLLPSVAAISDFSSALYVRGGSPDQNLFTLDGAPVFNPYHMGGLFGAIDPDAVAGVDVLPGAFPAAVGDRLSAAIDVRTREGGRDRTRGFGSVGLISSRAGIDGPLPGGSGSYLLTARRTYLDVFTDAAYALGMIGFTVPYHFTDAYLKLTRDAGPGRLTASAYVDVESLEPPKSREDGVAGEGESEEGARAGWGSRMASLSYRLPLGPTLVAEARASVSAFHGDFDAWETGFQYDSTGAQTGRSRVPIVDARTGMRDVLAAADLSWYGPGHRLRGGVQYDAYRFAYDVNHDGGDTDVVPPFRRHERAGVLAAYVEDEWTPREGLLLRGGLRVLDAGDRGRAWLPRLGARLQLTPDLSLSLAGGRSAQALRSLRNEESLAASLLAYDLLAVVPRETGLATAEDVVAGVEWARGSSSVRVDAFTKWLHRVPIAPPPDDVLEAPVVLDRGLIPGEGRASGVEVLARHARGRSEFTLAYSLLAAEMEAEGRRYTPRFERRHTLDAMAILPWGKRGTFSARLALATGQPYTPALGVTETVPYSPESPGEGGEPTVLLGEHNSARLPAYVRLDVGARRPVERTWFGKRMTLTPYFQVLNVLNTPNVLVGTPSLYGESGGPEVDYAPQLPILPTLGLEWKF